MNFRGELIISDMQIHEVVQDGFEFLHKSLRSEYLPSRARFVIKRKTTDVKIICPAARTETESLSVLLSRYNEEFGPYSTEKVAKKAGDVLKNIEETYNISASRREFTRKMWLVRELFELFEKSMGLIEVRMSKMVVTIYSRSIAILNQARTRRAKYGNKTMVIVDKIIALVERVQTQLVELIAKDARFLQLLTPNLLHEYVLNASPHMVSKLGSLPWIEPDTALIATPLYNLYWTEFWTIFMKKYFKINEEMCIHIAEYMPRYLCGENFLDYFRRNYDASNGRFLKKHAFKITKSTNRVDNIQLSTLTILFNK